MKENLNSILKSEFSMTLDELNYKNKVKDDELKESHDTSNIL